MFTDMLATLLEGGLTLTDSLRVLSGVGFPSPVRRGSRLVLESMRRGNAFSRALDELVARKDSPLALTRAHLALVDAASRTGKSEAVLREIARDIGARVAADGAFASALAYPALVVAFALSLTVVLRVRVLPYLALSGMDAVDVGGATRGIACALAFLASSLVVAYLAMRRVFRRDSGEYSVFSALAFLMANGVTLSESLARCLPCVSDAKTRAAVRMALRRLEEGSSIARAFAETGRFGALVSAWLEVADENGDPASAFLPIAAHFRARDARVREIASRMIEPTLMAITGVYVLILVETVVLPVLTIAGGLHA